MMELESYFLASGSVGDLNEPFSLDEDSPMSSEASTGYLQDAVVEWTERCKRRRTVSSCYFTPLAAAVPAPTAAEDIHQLVQGFWGSNCAWDTSGDLDSLFQDSSTLSDGNTFNFSDNMKQSSSEEETKRAATKAQKEAPLFSSSSSSSYENSSTILAKENGSNSSIVKQGEEAGRERKRRKKKVTYPFAVLKPAGLQEGEVTLAEINERILMRPTRPVKHPVGKFACMPCVPEADGGPGLSGKAVVGLTRIHTQGSGTITIIRTRG